MSMHCTVANAPRSVGSVASRVRAQIRTRDHPPAGRDRRLDRLARRRVGGVHPPHRRRQPVPDQPVAGALPRRPAPPAHPRPVGGLLPGVRARLAHDRVLLGSRPRRGGSPVRDADRRRRGRCASAAAGTSRCPRRCSHPTGVRSRSSPTAGPPRFLGRRSQGRGRARDSCRPTGATTAASSTIATTCTWSTARPDAHPRQLTTGDFDVSSPAWHPSGREARVRGRDRRRLRHRPQLVDPSGQRQGRAPRASW